jgi:hypothetical protein
MVAMVDTTTAASVTFDPNESWKFMLPTLKSNEFP